MEEKDTKKDVSYLQQLWDNYNIFINKVADKLKFKEDDTKFIKFLKVLLRIVGIIVLIAVSPIIFLTVLFIIIFAM